MWPVIAVVAQPVPSTIGMYFTGLVLKGGVPCPYMNKYAQM